MLVRPKRAGATYDVAQGDGMEVFRKKSPLMRGASGVL